MGILKESAEFVRALNLPRGFSVCELGDQQLSYLRARPSVEFYREIGCGRYLSIDGNGRGTVTADLNLPVTSLRLGVFDLVTDFGTGEHIFDQAQVFRTLHELVTPGGFIAFDRPTQGYGKHCFYLATEALYRDLTRANGYRIIRQERAETPRGWLVRGVWQRPDPGREFRVPQQARYRHISQLPAEVA